MSVSRRTLVHRLDRISPGLRRITSNMSWLMLDRLVRMGCGLFVGVWVARYLGPAQFGDLNFALAFIGIFGTLGTLGLETVVMREVLHAPDQKHDILGTSLLLRCMAGVITIGLALTGLRFMHSVTPGGWVLVGIISLSLLFQPFDTVDSYFQSELRSRLTVIAKNSSFLVFALARVLMIHYRAPLWAFAVAYTGEIALGAVGLAAAYYGSGGRMGQWRFRISRATRLLQQSWPVMLSGMAIMLYVRLDTVMLKAMQGDYAVGIYAAATRVSEVWYFIPTAIVTSISPALLAVKDSPEELDRRMQRLFSLMTFLALSVGTIVALGSGRLISLLYANSYRSAGPVLAVHVWASVFVFLGVAQSPWDLAKDLLPLALYRTIAGAAINAAVNIYLIPRYGPMGAAIATVISYAVSAVFVNFFMTKTRHIFFMQMRSFLPSRFWRGVEG